VVVSEDSGLVNKEDRRKGDRRKAQLAFRGPDRRKGKRRSGLDRRASFRETNARLFILDSSDDCAANREVERTQQTSKAERRGALRRHVQTTIHIRDAEGFRTQGEVVDLSVTGCKVAFRKGLGLTPGQTYTIKLGGLVLDAGCVSWSAPGKAGIEFLKPIYAPVMEDIVRRFPCALSTTSSGKFDNQPPLSLLK